MAKKKAVKKKTKKKTTKKASAPKARRRVIKTTSELAADPSNPRTITDEAAAGLGHSIKEFGDLSGIVFNKRTGELVCGHQRMAQIRKAYGEQEIEIVDAQAGIGRIVIDPEHYFQVRIVDWSQARQRAANVAANSQKISGKFSDDSQVTYSKLSQT